jgi:DNA-binding NarL/FixJ family response regulator
MCKVLIADDSEMMRAAIRKTLEEEVNIRIVGEASTFAETVQMVSDVKPDVLLLDLHMPEKRQIAPELVKAQLGTVCTVAISFANDRDSKMLAKSYGAATLLDKMALYTDMIPAIRRCHPELNLPKKPRNRRTHAA